MKLHWDAARTLKDQVAVTPRWRRNGLPADPSKVIVLAHNDSINEACSGVLAHSPSAQIVGFHAHKGDGKPIWLEVNGEKRIKIEAIPIDELGDHPDCAKVLFWKDCVAPDLLYHLDAMAKYPGDFTIFPEVPQGAPGRRIDAGLWRRCGVELENIYKGLADDESRLSFASIVKGLLRGEIEWVRPPVSPEYQHPEVSASSGDVVIDAGLFDSTVLRRFALAAGPDGHVYGFEPEPQNHAFVLETLRTFGDPGNITVERKALWSRKETLRISNEGASGRLGSIGSECEATDIDSFVEKEGIAKVDLIKMDIEGAECAALDGASGTIRRFAPKLQICAYHRPDDLIDIPRLIKSFDPHYKLWFTAHAPYLNEFVYYARCDRSPK